MDSSAVKRKWNLPRFSANRQCKGTDAGAVERTSDEMQKLEMIVGFGRKVK
jgi:hypothetical protein